MKIALVGPMLSAAIIGAVALTSPLMAKTAKECRSEWQANKAANQAKGITEKAYVDQCKAGNAKTDSKSNAVESKSKTKKETKTDTKKETKKEPKTESKSKKETASKMAAPLGGKKTVKECQDEWRANKAANQAKGITEKAYVGECRAGTAMKMEPTQVKMAPAASVPKEKETTKMTPASASPGMGKPTGANQYAAESQAKSHCRSDTVVWANLESKIYHFAGHGDYGHTKQGAYMCEKDAMGQGMRAAKNEKHP
jgi:hypothetical protein